jgi:L-histidine Nalpha-methyltransferase
MDQSRLEQALQQTGMELTLCFIGHGQLEKLDELNRGLKRPYDGSGRGKHIDSGFAYWGAGPTYHWTRACRDEIYRVMREGIESFGERWAQVGDLRGARHYVSLGVGTGEKDVAILTQLMRANPDLYYFPVDMSSDLMRTGVLHVLSRMNAPGAPMPALRRGHVLPVQIDFSAEKQLKQLRLLLDELVGDEPILFGLLGNTIANFDREEEVLRLLPLLVRPDKDLLLLETASTPDLSDAAMEAAHDEYAESRIFRTFAVSSILQNTDLRIDKKQTQFVCSPEGNGGDTIRIDVIYKSTADTEMILVGGDRVDFRAGDTIRLYVSRKYSDGGLERVLSASGLQSVQAVGYCKPGRGAHFGMTLSLCQFERKLLEQVMAKPRAPVRTSWTPAAAPITPSRAPRVFVSYAHEDAAWLDQLKASLEPSLQRGELELWDDSRIAPGERWREQIGAALLQCEVAVLLVSQNFIRSEYIADLELLPLLKASEERGLKILWIPISASSWRLTKLEELQAATSSPDAPLDTLSDPMKRAQFVEIAQKIRKAASAKRESNSASTQRRW